MQVTDDWRVSTYLQQICKCMHVMYEMYDPNYDYAIELC